MDSSSNISEVSIFFKSLSLFCAIQFEALLKLGAPCIKTTGSDVSNDIRVICLRA